MTRFIGILLGVLFVVGCSPKPEVSEVVLYTSVDQIFSEPILKGFEKETGIKVKVVYDVEAGKTTGLVNRLIAEKDRPRCDVFWNSEFGRTLVFQDLALWPHMRVREHIEFVLSEDKLSGDVIRSGDDSGRC